MSSKTTPDSIVDPLIRSDLGRKPYAAIVEGDSYLHAPEDGRSDTYGDDERGPGPRVMAADTLVGDDVKNDEGETLGQLTHIMIDVPTGRVAYGVLSAGGFLSMGEKLFAIPWSALRLDPADHSFRLSVSKERIEQAEGFDDDAWPTMADRRWAEGVHAYYGAKSYWD
jgi:sporulation protein YlmC with PRC-barrel domain